MLNFIFKIFILNAELFFREQIGPDPKLAMEKDKAFTAVSSLSENPGPTRDAEGIEKKIKGYREYEEIEDMKKTNIKGHMTKANETQDFLTPKKKKNNKNRCGKKTHFFNCSHCKKNFLTQAGVKNHKKRCAEGYLGRQVAASSFTVCTPPWCTATVKGTDGNCTCPASEREKVKSILECINPDYPHPPAVFSKGDPTWPPGIRRIK